MVCDVGIDCFDIMHQSGAYITRLFYFCCYLISHCTLANGSCSSCLSRISSHFFSSSKHIPMAAAYQEHPSEFLPTFPPPEISQSVFFLANRLLYRKKTYKRCTIRNNILMHITISLNLIVAPKSLPMIISNICFKMSSQFPSDLLSIQTNLPDSQFPFW